MLRQIKSALTHTVTSHSRPETDTLTILVRDHNAAHMWTEVQNVRDRFWSCPDRCIYGIDTLPL